MYNALIALLVCVNLIAFVLYGIDKQKAVHGKWRIPESILILTAICGGGIGAYLGMKTFHHKTRKPLFTLGVPLITLAEYAVLAYSFTNHLI